MPLHNKQIYNRNLKRKSHSVLDKGYTLLNLLKQVKSQSEVAELINLPFEEKTVILYKNKKTSIIHQFKYKVKKSINRRGEK